ncbi:phytosulfokines-like [Alnus glutinosa]|uniref:phytosulfokines-like n=1 Tax=Alnus glutinosa TaxID=3517 RepID=UPI002D78B333|nr:phytosulfokines-like [Alnus glutinosa]
MSQLSTLFTIALLVSLVLTQAARPEPLVLAGSDHSLVRTQQHGDVIAENAEVEDSCEGVEGKEECLMRRTLAAHLDYIYTQKHKP